MPESVLLEESELTAVRKAEFAETLRARLSEKVLSEIRLLADTLEGAISRVVFEDRGTDAVRENLEEFSRAVEAAIDGWVADSGNMTKLARDQRVGRLDVRLLAGLAINRVAKGRSSGGESASDRTRIDKGGTMRTTFTKSSDVIVEATREAEKLQRQFPDRFPSVVAARGQVWKDRPDLAEELRRLSDQEGRGGFNGSREHAASREAATGVSKVAPVEKGQSAVNKATEKARELVMQHPDRYQSVEQARAAVWRLFPELAEQYQEEAYR